MLMEKRCVCFGGSRTAADSPAGQLAMRCGEELARLGWTVMSGGYEGAMEAVSRGARQASGRVIGVTTPVFPLRSANRLLHQELTEPDYLARMGTLLRQGHAFVGLPGGLGTFSECLAAWCLASIGQLPGPLILFRAPWEALVQSTLELDEVEADSADFIRWVDEATDLERALAGS